MFTTTRSRTGSNASRASSDESSTTPPHPWSARSRSTSIATTRAHGPVLPDLVALGLEAKQGHWNVNGPIFLPLHNLTDAIAADARAWADRIAERAVALGSPVDARPATVGSTTSKLPAGWLTDRELISDLAERLDEVAGLARTSLEVLEAADPVGHDIVIETLEGLEKHAWMLRAHCR